MSPENLPPEVKFFELMKRIRKLGLASHSLEDGAASPAQMALLDWIASHPGCSLQEIADGLGLTPPTVSISVRKMEESGKVERKPNPADGRAVQFFLTERGQTLQGKIQNSQHERFRHLLAGLNGQEQQTLLALLERALNSAERDMAKKQD